MTEKTNKLQISFQGEHEYNQSQNEKIIDQIKALKDVIPILNIETEHGLRDEHNPQKW